MASIVGAVRASDGEWARWRSCAAADSLNGWIRRALNSQAELDEALAREAGRDEGATGLAGSGVAGAPRA